MEWKSNLRRVQSLRSVSSSGDQPTWTEAGLRGKITSVSQLVSRYQTTVEVNTSIQQTAVMNGEAKSKQLLKEITLLESKDICLEALMQRNEERQRSRAKTNLTRSKSMGSLQNSAGSIGSLKALFESKADTQDKVKSSFGAASSPSPYKAADIMPMMNGAVEGVKSPAEKLKNQISSDAPTNDAKDDHVTRKVMNQTRMDRRKTIGGIDFEKIAASQADEKRRSIADFRDSSFIQTKEKLSVSVKAMSALYLSKVASQESAQSLLKPGHDQSSESGKRVKLTKMAEDPHQRKDDHAPPPSTRHRPEDISGPHFQQSMPPQLSKEKLHEQRQKCELRRLLKHTHPELKMLDDVVDEELAEVLGSETGVTTGETGYEGEVLSRRLIFENCALSDKVSPYTPHKHMAERTLERGVSKTSGVFEAHEGRPVSESLKGIVEDHKILSSGADPNTESEEEMIRIDVQTTRRLFESQSVNTSRLYPDNKLQGRVSIPGDDTGAIQKQKQECQKENLHGENKGNASTKNLDLTDQTHKRGPSVDIIGQSTDHELSGWEEDSTGETAFEDELTSLPHAENSGEIIKTSAALFKNNPFIPTNIEREHSFVHTSKSQSPVGDSGAAQDFPIANVKNRAHLFESMPFDKIRQQNKDEVETMVENIKETLASLYQVNAIHSGGSIIEVNETMIAKKAKFTLSEGGPEINYDEVAEGGAQNFILQLLPRANLKPQITYLKEDSKGNMEATVVNVHVHQHQFTTNQDTEFKTANVVQVVEDILNQDNSLRKGVIIQEDVNRCAEIMVYSLYNYFDEEDVKSYCPPQGAEYDEPEPERVDGSQTDCKGLRKGTIESTTSCLLETSKDPACQGSIRSETEVKGNVKLFKSCIEKGDLEYLKSLQAEPTEEEQELPPNQNMSGQGMELHCEQRVDQSEESTSEWVPVDVKTLKNMFSGDQRPVQPKQNVYESLVQSTTVPQRDLGFLKSLPAEPTVQQQELSPNQHMAGQGMELHHEQRGDQSEESASEWVPVDVKRLKNMFSGDPRPVQPKQNAYENLAPSTTVPPRDLGFLKSLQTESMVQEQELSPNQHVAGQGMELHHEQRGDQTEESASEWVPVDVKKLKNMFSGDQRPVQPKQNIYENIAKSSVVSSRDLESLKCPQSASVVQEQELLPNQNVDGQSMEVHHEQRGDQAEESTSEWTPVDVKKLKNMFSGDPRPVQPKQNAYENLAQSTAISPGQNVPAGMSNSSTERNAEVLSPGQSKNTLRDCGAQEQKEACNTLVAPQGSYLHLETPDDDRVHQAELVEVVDEDDEISNLQTAIHSLQQATIEAKSLYQSSQAKQKLLVQESHKEHVVSATEGNVRHSRKEVELAQESEDQKEYPSVFQSTSNTTSEHKSDHQHENKETGCKDTKSEEVQTMQTCNKMGQKCTGMVQKSVMVSVHSSETTPAQQEDEDVVFQGKLQAALNSLERSNINVTKGDFRAAMIYKNSSKPHKEISQNVDAVSVQKSTKEESCPVTEPKSSAAPLRQEVSKEQATAANAKCLSQSETANKAPSSAVSEESKRPAGPKPAIPRKPERLKVKGDVQSINTKNPEATQTNTVRPNSCANTGPDLVDLQRNEPLDEAIQTEATHQVQSSVITLLNDNTDKNIIGQQQEINVTAEERGPQVKENMNETDESHLNFHEACHKFGGKKARQAKNAPVKPKRVKIAQSDNKNQKHMSGDNNSSTLTHVAEQPQQTLTGPSCSNPNTCGQTADSKGKEGKEKKHESKVEMREKKGRAETEDERRQRLSVHMDEIMRGNITAAMEIFDNLRKQEELKSILSRVEEIEQDTSGVDVRSLRGIFENVPDWVVSSDNKKHKKVKAENKGERMPLARDNTESKSSMAHVFGDLERASEEIMNLKEQTLVRLMDIEGAIKKALYSVSTLKSESDIAGLSCLFKESLGAVQGCPTSGNISKISIGSSKTKSLESPLTKGNPPLPVSKSASTEVASAKQKVSPASSPAFISIQSAARKADKSEVLPPETTICPTCQHSPKTEEKFRTTKTLTCNSPAQNRKRDPRKGGQKQSSNNPLNPKRELSVLEVQTDRDGNSVTGTTTVTENYERTDNFGNRFYSSKTSTVVTTQPETATSTGQAVVSQVTKYPEVRLPINQKP